MSQRLSASMSNASFSVVSFFACTGALPPTALVEKNTGSISAKSPSACIRSISTEPTMPRQPTSPTNAMSFALSRALHALNLSITGSWEPPLVLLPALRLVSPGVLVEEAGAKRVGASARGFGNRGGGRRADGGDDGVAHLARAHRAHARGRDVRGPQAGLQHRTHRRLDTVGGVGLLERVAEHHGG